MGRIAPPPRRDKNDEAHRQRRRARNLVRRKHPAALGLAELRLELLGEHPRLRKVLEVCAERARWASAPPPGRARGVAVHESFGSRVAEIAEVSVENGTIRVHKVVSAVDCGTAIHPDGVAAQMESSIIFGLSAALKQEAITFENGRVQQSNFHDFEILRMHEAPEIETHIVPRDDPPEGLGEPGLPPIAPAVANAVFALTKQRLRALPLRLPG